MKNTIVEMVFNLVMNIIVLSILCVIDGKASALRQFTVASQGPGGA